MPIGTCSFVLNIHKGSLILCSMLFDGHRHLWHYPTYVTRSRKRGPFPQKSVCELDLSADSAKSVVHARENRLTLARSVPKLQSFEYHTCAYLGFEISAFISVL